MAHITTAEAQAWVATTKLATVPFALDVALEEQISDQVLAQLVGVYDTSGWLNDATTPDLVRNIIAMLYTAWVYERQYSDDDNDSTYATNLRTEAYRLLDGIIRGVIDLPDPNLLPLGAGQPVFFPDDASSANCPSDDFPSDGGPKFLMGVVF